MSSAQSNDAPAPSTPFANTLAYLVPAPLTPAFETAWMARAASMQSHAGFLGHRVEWEGAQGMDHGRGFVGRERGDVRRGEGMRSCRVTTEWRSMVCFLEWALEDSSVMPAGVMRVKGDGVGETYGAVKME